jgi:hypothetical protein
VNVEDKESCTNWKKPESHQQLLKRRILKVLFRNPAMCSQKNIEGPSRNTAIHILTEEY